MGIFTKDEAPAALDVQGISNLLSAGMNQYSAFKDAAAVIDSLKGKDNYIAEQEARVAALDKSILNRKDQLEQANIALGQATKQAEGIIADAQTRATSILDLANENALALAADITGPAYDEEKRLIASNADLAEQEKALKAEVEALTVQKSTLDGLVTKARAALGA
jgi:hypothetical protein